MIKILESDLKQLRNLAIRDHYYCEDSWYSCPLAPDGCCNDAYPENECNCGADKHNLQVDVIFATLLYNSEEV